MRRLRSSMLPLLLCVVCDAACPQQPLSSGDGTQAVPVSTWATRGPDGRLVYATTERGDRIMDFSYAGYMGGGVGLPDVPAVKVVKPSGDRDDSDLIQRAIDQVAAMPRTNGFRGAVLLAPGVFTCSKSIVLSVGSVVLRGSGTNGSTIKMVGEKHCAIVILSARRSHEAIDDTPLQTIIQDAYLPSGAVAFSVAESRGFAVGDEIIIQRPITPAWLHLMRMDDLKRDGRGQTFIPTTRIGQTARVIKSIDGDRITINVPLSDCYDAQYLNPPGTRVTKAIARTTVTQVGIENIHIQCPPLAIKYTEAPYAAIRVGGDDCWVRDVHCEETINSTAVTGNRVTMQRVVVTHSYPNLGASKPCDFSIEGCQVLIDRCRATGGNTYFVWTGSLVSGPNVVLNSSFSGYGNRLQPHQRWSTGLLLDNCRIPDGGIDFMNRGVAGSGHGWTMGWGVAWNCLAGTYIIQQPPGACNWAIGCIGARRQTARLFDTRPILPEGNFDSHGSNVAPQSLYLAQLEERLGPQALTSIGYASNTRDELEDKTLVKLPELNYDEDQELGKDLAMHRPVNANNVRGMKRDYAAENALDGSPVTYWATDDGVSPASFEVDMENPVPLTAAQICEAPGLEGSIQEYRIEGQVDSDWKLLARGTTVGRTKVDSFPKETVWKVRLTVTKLRDYVAITKFGLYAK